MSVAGIECIAQYSLSLCVHVFTESYVYQVLSVSYKGILLSTHSTVMMRVDLLSCVYLCCFGLTVATKTQNIIGVVQTLNIFAVIHLT